MDARSDKSNLKVKDIPFEILIISGHISGDCFPVEAQISPENKSKNDEDSTFHCLFNSSGLFGLQDQQLALRFIQVRVLILWPFHAMSCSSLC